MGFGNTPPAQIIRAPLRQYAPEGSYTFSASPSLYTLDASQMVNTLGQNNGHNGQVMTFMNFGGADPHLIQLSGFAGPITFTFDHYAGMLSNGHLIPNISQAYFHIHDAADSSHDGYILYVVSAGDARPGFEGTIY